MEKSKFEPAIYNSKSGYENYVNAFRKVINPNETKTFWDVRLKDGKRKRFYDWNKIKEAKENGELKLGEDGRPVGKKIVAPVSAWEITNANGEKEILPEEAIASNDYKTVKMADGSYRVLTNEQAQNLREGNLDLDVLNEYGRSKSEVDETFKENKELISVRENKADELEKKMLKEKGIDPDSLRKDKSLEKIKSNPAKGGEDFLDDALNEYLEDQGLAPTSAYPGSPKAHELLNKGFDYKGYDEYAKSSGIPGDAGTDLSKKGEFKTGRYGSEDIKKSMKKAEDWLKNMGPSIANIKLLEDDSLSDKQIGEAVDTIEKISKNPGKIIDPSGYGDYKKSKADTEKAQHDEAMRLMGLYTPEERKAGKPIEDYNSRHASEISDINKNYGSVDKYTSAEGYKDRHANEISNINKKYGGDMNKYLEDTED